MLLWMLLPVLLVGVSSRMCVHRNDTDDHTACNYCYYNHTDAPAKPQLLWATSNSAVLRARVCGCWCLDKMFWYFRNITKDNSVLNFSAQIALNSCGKKEYCQIFGESGSRVLVYSSFFNYRVNGYMLSSSTYVRFCPDDLPARPTDVSCRKHEGQPQLRWTYKVVEPECQSYLQFMVRSGNVSQGWYWLGEASPVVDGTGGEPFGGLVHRCPDNPKFLCANLNKTLSPQRVQLGVRRTDADEVTRMSTTKDFVECSEHNDDEESSAFPPEDSQETTRVVPPGVPTFEWRPALPPAAQPTDPQCPTTESPALGSGESLRGGHRCTMWRVMALVALCGLLACVALLPLAFYAGRRSKGKKQLCVSWQQLQEDRADFHRMHDRAANFYEDRPPVYEYDYAHGGLQPLRSPLPPPLPALPPPLPPPRQDPYTEVLNDMYSTPEYTGSSPEGTKKHLHNGPASAT